MRTARDVMTANPTTIRAGARVSEAIALLQDLNVRHLPVVNPEHELVGMLSDRDIRGLSVPAVIDRSSVGRLRSALDAPVSSIMSGDVVFVDEAADLIEIVDLMLDAKVGAVPVIDGDRGLVGIVSYVDLLRALAELEVNAAE